MFRIRASIAVLTSALLLPSVSQADLIQTTNLIVTGNLTTGAEVQGRAIVGTLNASGGGNAENFTIGNGTILPASYNGSNGLVVGGSISGGNPGEFKVEGGNALVGGSVSNNQIQVANGQTVTANSSQATSIVSQAASQITNLSNYYSGLTANSTVNSPNGQPTAIVFTAASGATNGVAVFNVNASIFSSQYSQSFNLVANGDTTFVINVIGSSATFNVNFLSGFSNYASDIIFNFETATSVSTQVAMYGSILAPDATLTNSTAINGSVFVQNFNQQGEVHLPNFAGYDPYAGAVPVPASAILLGLGLPGGWFATRISRRNRKS